MRSRSNYLFVTLLIVTVLVLCQLFGMSLNLFDAQYQANQYAELGAAGADASPRQPDTALRVAIVSERDDSPRAVWDACDYMGLNARRYATLADVPARDVDFLVLADCAQIGQSLPLLLDYNARGVPMLFCELPDAAALRTNDALRALLGILSLDAQPTRVTGGVRLFEGFLLGGSATYEDWQPSVPRVELLAGYKVYLVGYSEGKLPTNPKQMIGSYWPLLWRYGTETGAVFVSNGVDLSHGRGAGLFAALVAETTDALLYPVVNAQVSLADNLVTLSSENETQMRLWYGHTSDQFLVNTLLPRVIAIMNNTGGLLTCTLAGRLNPAVGYAYGASESLPLYIRQIVGQAGELGLSGCAYGGGDAAERLSDDLSLLSQTAPGYTPRVFSPSGMHEADYAPLLEAGGLLSDVRTLILPRGEDGDIGRFAYYRDNVVSLPVTHDAFSHGAEDDLALRSLETVLLSSVTRADVSRVVYPESDADDWALLGVRWGKLVGSYWTPYRKLAHTTASQAGERARAFLNARWRVTRNENALFLDLAGGETPVYFLLRAPDKKIAAVSGAEYVKLEDGVFLVTARAEKVVVLLESAQRIFFHD